MLVLTRKPRESVVVSRKDSGQATLTVTVLEVNGSKVRLGFEGDPDCSVHRQEVWERIRAAVRTDSPADKPAAAKVELDRWDNEGGGPGPLKQSSGISAASSSHGRDG